MSLLLSVKDLHVSIGGTEIVGGVNIDIHTGEVHAVMGPNGSGKSTLVQALMGHPKYTVTTGSVKFMGKNLLTLKSDERAKLGLFLAFQYPKEIAGVTFRSFLFAAYRTQAKRLGSQQKLSPLRFKKLLDECMEALHMDPTLAERSVNQGFSGGEKKKAEILQLKVLRPRLALLDETDSGLDIDALKTVAKGVNSMRAVQNSFLIVTHYARILDYITPDQVHVMVKGKLVESGGAALARRLEKEGYGKYV